MVVSCVALLACRPKASSSQCDRLVERYAHLMVAENFPDASPERSRLEEEREKGEARAEDGLKNCSSEVSQAEFECAMRAASVSSFGKCLE